jgi:hypothetical protein
MAIVYVFVPTQPFTLNKGYRMRALENRTLRSILGSKREELEGWKKF